jgi:hypothetical protein
MKAALASENSLRGYQTTRNSIPAESNFKYNLCAWVSIIDLIIIYYY